MICDFHNDFLTSYDFLSAANNYVRSDNKIVSAIFKGKNTFSDCRKLATMFSLLQSDNLYLSYEDFSYDGDIDVMASLFDICKPVTVGITWNHENSMAYGAASNGKIKTRGKLLIGKLVERGIYLDVAHLSGQSFYDAFLYTDKIVCTHTCFYDINPHFRNLKYGQLKSIVDSGGLVGLTFYTPFLTDNKTADVSDVIRHIDYFCGHFSPDYLCIGTDFYGCADFPTQFSDYAFESILRDRLVAEGYSRADIDKILYKNLLNFLDRKKIKVKDDFFYKST